MTGLDSSGLRVSVEGVAAVMAAHAHRDVGGPGWYRLSTASLLWRAVRHTVRVMVSPGRIDPDSGHPEAWHAAARWLMVASRLS
jgi:hypothetical protein